MASHRDGIYLCVVLRCGCLYTMFIRNSQMFDWSVSLSIQPRHHLQTIAGNNPPGVSGYQYAICLFSTTTPPLSSPAIFFGI